MSHEMTAENLQGRHRLQT